MDQVSLCFLEEISCCSDKRVAKLLWWFELWCSDLNARMLLTTCLIFLSAHKYAAFHWLINNWTAALLLDLSFPSRVLLEILSQGLNVIIFRRVWEKLIDILSIVFSSLNTGERLAHLLAMIVVVFGHTLTVRMCTWIEYRCSHVWHMS